MSESRDDVFRLDSVKKSYGRLKALDAVDMTFRGGKIHGLVGHNGAGKSTLVKAVSGVVQPDSGVLRLDGQPVRFHSPAAAVRAGVVPIHQDVAVIGNLSVERNLSLGVPRLSGEHVRSVLSEVGLAVEPTALAGALAPPAQRLVMIAQALVRKPRVLLLDEPTTVLDRTDVDRLFALLRGLRERGLSLIYISHRLEEVLRICDEITVMRQGRVVSRIPDTQHLSADALAAAIVGSPQQLVAKAKVSEPRDSPSESTPPLLTVADMRSGRKLKGVTLTVRRGEIVGIAGLVGSGRSMLLRSIAGLQKRNDGSVIVDGEELRSSRPRDALKRGVVYVSERPDEAGIGAMTVTENLLLPQLTRHYAIRGLPVLSKRHMRDAVADIVRELSIGASAGSAASHVSELSGGNRRKVAIARWILLGARVFLLDEPTIGLDVGAREAVYEILRSLTATGACVLLTSADIEEVVSISDRVFTLSDGQIVAEFTGAEKTEEAVSLACFGGGKSTQKLQPTT